MKILITGGAGFIASHIADRYLSLGHEVIILDNLITGFRKNLPAKAKFYQLSIESPEIEEVFSREKPEIVNHHAAQIDVRKSVADPAADAKINIVGTLNLLENCRRHGVKKVVFASTGGAIYGEPLCDQADETHPTNPQSPYGIAKLAIEKYLQFYRETHKIDFVALRYGNVYGPRQNALGEAGVIAIFLGKLLKGEPPLIYGTGEQTRDYVFVQDVVDCNVAALDSDTRGIFNVGTGIETSVNRIARELIRLTGLDLSPKFSAARLGEQMRSCLQPGSIQKQKPVAFPEGLRITANWFKSNWE